MASVVWRGWLASDGWEWAWRACDGHVKVVKRWLSNDSGCEGKVVGAAQESLDVVEVDADKVALAFLGPSVVVVQRRQGSGCG